MSGTKRDVIVDNNRDLGCLGRAAFDEPVFVLRAKDKFAVQLIENWVGLVEADSVPYDGKPWPAVTPFTAKTINARQVANDMRTWQLKHGSHTPD